MAKELISNSSVNLSWVYLVADAMLTFVMLAMLFANEYFLSFSCLLAVIYLTYTSFLSEVSFDKEGIYINRIFKNEKRFPYSDFRIIESNFLILGALQIRFKDSKYNFSPKLPRKLFNSDNLNNFIEGWNSAFRNAQNTL